MELSFRPLIFLGMASTMFACAAPDYTEQIAEIDSQIIKLDEAHLKFAALRIDSMTSLGRKVEQDMKLVSKKFEGELPLEKAIPINDYRGIKSLVKKTKPLIANAKVEIPEVRQQLVSLRKALTDKADRDAKGARINSEYVAIALQNEKLAAEFAITQVDDIEQRVNDVFARFEDFYPKVQLFLDSLRNLPE